MVVVTDENVQDREDQLQQEEHRIIALDYATRIYQGSGRSARIEVLLEYAEHLQQWIAGKKSSKDFE